MKTICLKGRLFDISTPTIIGILNVTPDSFYDGGKYQGEKRILQRAEQILNEGGQIIDIGGYSSRPNAEDISIEEEKKRVLQAIDLILKHFSDALISIDTFRAEVAKQAVEAGACMVNDISGGALDDKMFETVAALNVPYILMHSRGTPQTMMQFTHYHHILLEILDYFQKKVHILINLGVKDIIIDPGFGFAKNIPQNYELLNHLEYLKILGLPLVVGISRKSMIYKVLDQTPEDALNGTTILNTVALLKQSAFLRVHDVKEAVEIVELLNC
jgi:dihydropteroate synthase